MKIYENLHVYSYKTPIKRAQLNFLQTTRKPGRIFNYFYHGFDDFFSAFDTSFASVADHRRNFPKSVFIVKQVVWLFSGINVPLPKVIFSQVFEKVNCNAFKNVM